MPLEISGDCSPKLPGLVGLPLIVNRITDPTLLLMEGIDYTVVDGTVVFPNERLDDPLVPRDGDVACLWGFRGRFDREYLAKHFGYWLDIPVQSCQPDKNIVNAVIDCIVGGTTMAELERLVAAVLAVPVAEGQERVILDAEDRRGRFLATGRNVYRIAKDAVVGAPVGSELRPGQPLVRAFKLSELRHLPPETVVTLPKGMASDYASNTVKAGEVKTDSCIAVQLADMARMTSVLAHLRRVVPPQTGIVFAALEQQDASSDSTTGDDGPVQRGPEGGDGDG
jgi:hypothetical protein